jgi:hypothetical protein
LEGRRYRIHEKQEMHTAICLGSFIRRELGTDEKVILKQMLENYVIKM